MSNLLLSSSSSSDLIPVPLSISSRATRTPSRVITWLNPVNAVAVSGINMKYGLGTKVSIGVISVSLIFAVLKMSQLLDKAKNYVADKVANMPKPEASVTDVDFKRVSMECVEYLAKVSVSNPYKTPIPICEIKYSLKSAGREIASGTIPDPGSLKANDTTMLDVPVKVPHSILLSLARDIGADWDIDYQLDLGLVIDLPVIGNFTIPLSQKGEIKLPTLTDMFTSKQE